MLTAEIKKEFQKVIATIRKELNKAAGCAFDYPKAMMTGQQMRKNTATVNCGHSFTRRNQVLQHPAFMAFCKKYNAVATAEQVGVSPGTVQHQARLRFQEVAPQIIGADLALNPDRTGCFGAIKKPAEVQ